MRVRQLMRRTPRHANAGESLARAAKTMAEAGVGVLPVIDKGGRVTAVVTDRDVCCALALGDRRPSEILIGEIASAPPFTCGADDDVSAALATMRAFAVRRLPVVDALGRLEGMLSLDEIVLAAHRQGGDRLGSPAHAEVIETLQAIVRPVALAMRSSPGAATTAR